VLQAGARGYVLKSDADENLIARSTASTAQPFLTLDRHRIRAG
jgi:hypothetical protein